jgi:hypothetical protein
VISGVISLGSSIGATSRFTLTLGFNTGTAEPGVGGRGRGGRDSAGWGAAMNVTMPGSAGSTSAAGSGVMITTTMMTA